LTAGCPGARIRLVGSAIKMVGYDETEEERVEKGLRDVIEVRVSALQAQLIPWGRHPKGGGAPPRGV